MAFNIHEIYELNIHLHMPNKNVVAIHGVTCFVVDRENSGAVLEGEKVPDAKVRLLWTQIIYFS